MFLKLTLVGHWNMWLKIIFLYFYRNIVCQMSRVNKALGKYKFWTDCIMK